MPTVILLDVSLSMCRQVTSPAPKEANSSGEALEVRHLANVGIETLLDYFARNAQLEYTALVVFSSLWEIRKEFTRQHDSIKQGIYDLELYDKSNIVNAMRGVLSLKLDEWVHNGPVNVILITDGLLYHESTMCEAAGVEPNDLTSDAFLDSPLTDIEGQFDFPCKIQVVCLTSPKETSLNHSLHFYKKLISTVDSSITAAECPVIVGPNVRNFKQSSIWMPKCDNLEVSVEAIEAMFSKIAELHYKPYHATLSCGHLTSMVMISPKPTDCLLEPLKNEFDDLKYEQSLKEEAQETFVSAINKVRLYKLNDEINICGFMPLADIASPSVTSRHLVLPIVNSKFNETSKAEQILSQDPNAYNNNNSQMQTCSMDGVEVSEGAIDNNSTAGGVVVSKGKGAKNDPSSRHASDQQHQSEQDVTKQPSFCVLLHNSLKQENMVAICIVGKNEETNDDWYGMLHSNTDSKKRSSLMLSLLIPGSAPVLWLPNFKTMGSAQLNADLPPAIRDKIANNSRGPVKSYSSNSVIWLDPESVQADVQKIVRHAKRSPDKAPHFYKELNRIRRAAISYGFYDVLFGLASILEREKRVMELDQSKAAANQEMLAHIDHVVACLRQGLTEDSYDTNIMPKV